MPPLLTIFGLVMLLTFDP